MGNYKCHFNDFKLFLIRVINELAYFRIIWNKYTVLNKYSIIKYILSILIYTFKVNIKQDWIPVYYCNVFPSTISPIRSRLDNKVRCFLAEKVHLTGSSN